MPVDLKMIPQSQIDTLFEATADAVEETILNALTSAETMTGFNGIQAHWLPVHELGRLVEERR